MFLPPPCIPAARSLEEGLDKFFASETLCEADGNQYKCPKCDKLRDAEKGSALRAVPCWGGPVPPPTHAGVGRASQSLVWRLRLRSQWRSSVGDQLQWPPVVVSDSGS